MQLYLKTKLSYFHVNVETIKALVSVDEQIFAQKECK